MSDCEHWLCRNFERCGEPGRYASERVAMPAELFDAVLTAARALIDEFIATGSAKFVPLIEALDAYDAHRPTR